ncbi:putative 2OG-Fe(II) oxygenase [Undibacterium sp. TS12]|uniref:putative 2OG-Fe(II) oxygenase n=1 Tax=Undibacterium sp. TS12 TaxID=2908202 RepID=UPI001F4CFCF9|nr:putative 2OG-Fe(II) oxygenase [Undibacterium sp. TS12]MCH8619968.1 2OG-Fe(II) oxygenase family protein [Undibacterium sp. TS12]
MDIEVLFPTLVGISQADHETILRINEEVLQHKDVMNRLLSHAWGDNVLSSFDREKNIFAHAHLHALRKFVEDSILEFVHKTRRDKDWKIDHQYTQSWINVTKKFGYQERHNHERNVEGLPISGAYYFSTNQHDGDLAIFPVDMHYKQFENYIIQPEVGKLVLFRSDVFHRVGANLTDTDRVSFSFNYLLNK